MSFNVIDQYNSFVENNFIKSNKEQLEILAKIKSIWTNKKKSNLFLANKKKRWCVFIWKSWNRKNFLIKFVLSKLKSW